MKIFRTNVINGIPYLGYFENRDIAKLVIKYLENPLNFEEISKSAVTSNQKYVLAFSMDGKLYISRRGYYAFLVTKKGVWHTPRGLEAVPFPGDGVLVLSTDYIDDIPKYTKATEFCRTMNSFYFHQYCVVMRHNHAAMTGGGILH